MFFPAQRCFSCSPASQTQSSSKQATQTGCPLLGWFVLLKTNKTIQGNPWNMLSLLQHLSSDDFRMFYEAQGVLKSQGLPVFYGVSWNPGFTRSVGSIQQDTVLWGCRKHYHTLLTSLTHQSHPSQPSSWQDLGSILLHVAPEKPGGVQVPQPGKPGLTLSAQPGLRGFQCPERR